MKIMTFKINIILLMFALSFDILASDFNRIKVTFGGITYTGDANKQAQELKYFGTNLLDNSETKKQYNVELFHMLSKTESMFDITGNLIDTTSGVGNVLSVGFDYEQLIVTPISGNKTNIVGRLFAQVMIFDFINKKLLKTFPIIISFNDTITGIHSVETIPKAEYEKIFKVVYKDLLQKQVLEFIENSSVDFFGDGYNLKIRNISLGKHALKAINNFNDDPESFKKRVALNLSANIASKHNVPIVPYTKGKAIGTMSVKLANLEAQSFTLPEGDYYMDVEIVGLKEKILEKTELQTGVTYISALNFTFFDDFKNKVLADFKLQSGVPHVFPNEIYKEIDSWEEMNNSLIVLIQNFASEITSKNKTYLDTVIRDKLKRRKKMKQLEEIEKALGRIK